MATPGLAGEGVKAVKPPVSSWTSAEDFQMVDAFGEGLADAEDHGCLGAEA